MACLQKTKLFMIWEPKSYNNQNERQPHMRSQDLRIWDQNYGTRLPGNRVRWVTLTMNGWNSWLSTGLDQIMILLRDIPFDLPFVPYMCVLETISL